MMNMAQPACPVPEHARILIRGVNWLGDAVMTTPALLRLRERFSRAHLAILTPAKMADLWRHHPALDQVMTFSPEDGLRAVSATIRAGNFDVALVFPNSPRSVIEPWLARIPTRVGFARGWRRALLTTAIADRPGSVKMRKRSATEVRRLISHSGDDGREPAPRIDSAAHQLHEYLHLASALGARVEPIPPALTVTKDEVESAARRFSVHPEQGVIVGLNPGAEYGPAKRWPAEHFAVAARLVQQQLPCTWLIFGGKNDVAGAADIEARLGFGTSIHNLAGKTNLRELMALLKLCRVLVTNDTGPMHVAAALGTHVVVPFGSTSPDLTGPGLPGGPPHALLRSDVACAPCFRRECPIDLRCLRGISPSAVADAVLDRIRRFGSPKVHWEPQ